MTPTDRAALRAAAEKATQSGGVMVHTWTGSGDSLQSIGTTSEGTAAALALLDDVERMREALSMCLRVMEGIAHHEASPMGRACSAGNAALEPRA